MIQFNRDDASTVLAAARPVVVIQAHGYSANLERESTYGEVQAVVGVLLKHRRRK